jgi:CrcB protein
MNILSEEVTVVAIGGAIGSVARFMLSRFVQIWVPYPALPWGIIIVNLIGCFSFGVLYSVFEMNWVTHPLWRAGLLIGVLGGFTTFSSFSFDTFHLIHKGEMLYAFYNIFISVLGCLVATCAGYYAMRCLFN